MFNSTVNSSVTLSNKINETKSQSPKMTLNTMKMLIMAYDEDNNQSIPELLMLDYFSMQRIKGHFAVLHNGQGNNKQQCLLSFNSLLAAFKYVENLDPSISFSSAGFFNNYRIVEISPDFDEEIDDYDDILDHTINSNQVKIKSVIINCVDFFEILLKVKHNSLQNDTNNVNDFFNDADFTNYYKLFSDLV